MIYDFTVEKNFYKISNIRWGQFRGHKRRNIFNFSKKILNKLLRCCTITVSIGTFSSTS